MIHPLTVVLLVMALCFTLQNSMAVVIVLGSLAFLNECFRLYVAATEPDPDPDAYDGPA